MAPGPTSSTCPARTASSADRPMNLAPWKSCAASAGNLAQTGGVQVSPVVGSKRKGVDTLKAAIRHATVAPLPDFPLPDAMKEELMLVGGGLAIIDSEEAPGEKIECQNCDHKPK